MSWYELIEDCGADTIVRRFKTKMAANEYYDKYHKVRNIKKKPYFVDSCSFFFYT